jgi:hypothetical protein
MLNPGNHNPSSVFAKRIALVAERTLLEEYPDLELNITEITKSEEIEKYTSVLIAPSFVINEKFV